MEQGTALFLTGLSGLDDADLLGPTGLPGWTGRHLVAHVAANASALGNLAHWAATGEATPMYSSPHQRTADIERGALMSPGELRTWVVQTAEELTTKLTGLEADDWLREVVTAQGRTVPATEIPWLRAREVMVHSVDLGSGLGFGDLPESFLVALVDDVVAKRSAGGNPSLVLHVDGGRGPWTIVGEGRPTEVHGSVAGIAAYLSGRPTSGVTAAPAGLPALPAWL